MQTIVCLRKDVRCLGCIGLELKKYHRMEMPRYFKNTEVNRTWGNVSVAFHHCEVMIALSVTQHRAHFLQPLL